jgi:hypothetical protein
MFLLDIPSTEKQPSIKVYHSGLELTKLNIFVAIGIFFIERNDIFQHSFRNSLNEELDASATDGFCEDTPMLISTEDHNKSKIFLQ